MSGLLLHSRANIALRLNGEKTRGYGAASVSREEAHGIVSQYFKICARTSRH
jgi:hypothetical protein